MQKRKKILVVDDEFGVRESFRTILERNHELQVAANRKETLALVGAGNSFEIIFLDIRLPDSDGLDLLRELKRITPSSRVIMVTAVAHHDVARTALQEGAYDYLTKPFDVVDIISAVDTPDDRADEFLHEPRPEDYSEEAGFDGIITTNLEMLSLYREIVKIAPSDTTVLITGESGTGKELAAQAIHRHSRRVDKPFIAVNCAAIPPNLMESEFFGHVRGAFTGATEHRKGRFEMANGGTLMLDEVSCLELDLQAKLLRVLEEMEFEPVGSSVKLKVDVRVIAATNRDLKEETAAGKFREDLYYRLNVIPLNLPSLNRRKDDIPCLVNHFIKKFRRKLNTEISGISRGALVALEGYSWPGNVRELENLIERLMVTSNRQRIQLHDLPLDYVLNSLLNTSQPSPSEFSLKSAVKTFERTYILRMLEMSGWNRTKTAQKLGIHRNTLLTKMNELDIRKGQ